MRKLLKVFDTIETIFTNVVFLFVVLFVFVAAVMRWGGHPIAWGDGLAELLVAWLTFVGANKALKAERHIGVDFIVKRLPKKVEQTLQLIMLILIGILLALCVFYSIDLSIQDRQRVINTLPISYSYVMISAAVGCFLMFVQTVGNILKKIPELFGGGTQSV